MTTNIILFRPNPEQLQDLKDATTKYANINNLQIELIVAKSSAEVTKNFDNTGTIDSVVICPLELEPVDLNSIATVYLRRKKKPPILLPVTVYEKIGKMLSGVELKHVNKPIDKHLFTEYLKELIVVDKNKIDKRIIKEILTSIVEIIHENTTVRLDVAGLNESKSKDTSQAVTAVTSYMGDGLMGTLGITTSLSMLNLLTQKMLYCEADQITDDMRNDVLGELSNQILGAFRQNLAKIGYQMAVSMQMVVSGEQKHIFQNRTKGFYYGLNFKHSGELFDVSFAYGGYEHSPTEMSTSDQKGLSCLDVRLVNSVFDAVGKIINVNGVPAVKKGINKQLARSYQAETMHLINSRGGRGGFLLGLEMPLATVRYYAKETMGFADSDVNEEMVNDICGELLNQISGVFRAGASVADNAYSFHNLFHGDFCGQQPFSYLLRNQGLYVRVPYHINNYPFTLCFGMDATYVNPYFDLWHFLTKIPGFDLDKQA